MRSFLTSWLIMTIAAAVMVAVTPGMDPVGEPPILGIAAFALFMALINASIKPIVHLIALPFAILSLGLVTLIINWLSCDSPAGWRSVCSAWASSYTVSGGRYWGPWS